MILVLFSDREKYDDIAPILFHDCTIAARHGDTIREAISAKNDKKIVVLISPVREQIQAYCTGDIYLFGEFPEDVHQEVKKKQEVYPA